LNIAVWVRPELTCSSLRARGIGFREDVVLVFPVILARFLGISGSFIEKHLQRAGWRVTGISGENLDGVLEVSRCGAPTLQMPLQEFPLFSRVLRRKTENDYDFPTKRVKIRFSKMPLDLMVERT
jgi:hypothetical protein